MCVCVCVHTHTHVHKHTYMHTCTHRSFIHKTKKFQNKNPKFYMCCHSLYFNTLTVHTFNPFLYILAQRSITTGNQCLSHIQHPKFDVFIGFSLQGTYTVQHNKIPHTHKNCYPLTNSIHQTFQALQRKLSLKSSPSATMPQEISKTFKQYLNLS